MPALQPQESDALSQPYDLIEHFQAVRSQTEQLCARLEIEDWVVQPAPFVSPPKWHLAHSTWFFVNFGLHAYGVNYPWPDEHYPRLFNSYYKSQSAHWQQGARGELSRPTVNEIIQFRHDVDERVLAWLSSFDDDIPTEVATVIRLGLEHEQQHQELLLMDIKFIFWTNPSKPIYFNKTMQSPSRSKVASTDTDWWQCPGGLSEFGSMNTSEFCFDNETPRHRAYLRPFGISTSLVSNQDYLNFIEDGGYRNSLFWLSEGWELVDQAALSAPLYWEHKDGVWLEFSLAGMQPLEPHSAVKHISYHEAYAYARWQGKRLPTEFEWELFAVDGAAASAATQSNHFLESTLLHNTDNVAPHHVHGGLWEWTSSPYSPYPGYSPTMDAFGEYNGKFMINQIVLRGGCFATPANHYRASYRNFYQPSQRWCFNGIRLAEDTN